MGGHGSGLAGHGGPMGLWLGQEGPGVRACSIGLCSISPKERRAVPSGWRQSWLVWCGDHVVMSTRGNEKDVEKGLSTPERTPKVSGMAGLFCHGRGEIPCWLCLAVCYMGVQDVLADVLRSDQDRGKAKEP
ncbi:hypothetical protein Bca52824_034336 [Brassica carinata]|uniref:Uncharacterized protein n=1 Tax=Brassica carinata TaxID=52824 RepID=A0A8X7S5G6_BRACI|nr:hypothetical protein Bca52824_034336 [Brassica carinata]